MSSVRVLVGTRKGAFILAADGKREKWDVSGPHFAGWEMYHLKGSPLIRIGFMRHSPAVGPDKSCSAPMTAAKLGRQWATSSYTKESLARISGTTAPRTLGNSNACGISNRR